jgi:acyl-CoA thioesterase-1
MFSRHMRQGWGYGRGGAFVNRRWVLALITLLLGAAPLAFIPGEAAAAGATRILAFGDSLTAGFGLAPQDGFTVQLAARLKTDGYAVDIINAGVSGDTTSDGLARLDWSLADHPDMVLLELGANDALRGIDPKLARANLDAMLARLTAAHLKVLLIGMKAPGNWGADYQKSFDGIYPALAAKYGVPLYPFYLDGVALDATLNQADGLHPNEAGVKVIVARMAPVIERMLGKQGG